MIDLAPHVETICRALLGEPNRALSTKSQLRFGSHGSLAVEIAGPKAGEWFDHENQVGGGPLDLLKAKAGLADGDAAEWLRRQGIPAEHSRSENRRIIATYDYRDEKGVLLYQAVRFEAKDFRQRRPDGDGWKWNLDGVRRVPYRLPEILAAPPESTVFIVEGEKDVEALRSRGLLATTNSEGAGKWRSDFARFFRGRDVIILPDNDAAGRAHARSVVAALAAVAKVRILELPGLPPKGDVSDWLAAGNSIEKLHRLADTAPFEETGAPESAVATRLSLAHWLSLDMPPPDFLLGEVLSTTSRAMLVAPTGIGKTNFSLALGMAIAAGGGFLHWRPGEGPRRVLFVDGEMSSRLMRRRLEDTARRLGDTPADFFVLNRELHPDMPPLDTAEGQKFIEDVIAAVGGVDLIEFDNVQALIAGSMIEEEPWQRVLPWARSLTARTIGQLWVHHTGHDETHAYGTKTREWQLDTVMLAERIERPDADIAFRLSFPKARERTPENRADFEPAVISLVADQWQSERSREIRARRTAKERALDLLRDAITRDGEIPAANGHIPAGKPCVTEKLWREYCLKGCISEGNDDATGRAFRRAAKAHLDAGKIGKWGNFVWLV